MPSQLQGLQHVRLRHARVALAVAVRLVDQHQQQEGQRAAKQHVEQREGILVRVEHLAGDDNRQLEGDEEELEEPAVGLVAQQQPAVRLQGLVIPPLVRRVLALVQQPTEEVDGDDDGVDAQEHAAHHGHDPERGVVRPALDRGHGVQRPDRRRVLRLVRAVDGADAALHQRAQRQRPHRDHGVGAVQSAVVTGELGDEQDRVDGEEGSVGDEELAHKERVGVVRQVGAFGRGDLAEVDRDQRRDVRGKLLDKVRPSEGQREGERDELQVRERDRREDGRVADAGRRLQHRPSRLDVLLRALRVLAPVAVVL